MRGKKGGLFEVFTTPGAMIGIAALLILFMVAMGAMPDPGTTILANEIETYGDLFLINYLKFPINYNGYNYTIGELLIMYYDSDYQDNNIENLIVANTQQIIDGLFESNSCLRIRFNNIVIIDSSSLCNENKIMAETLLPYKSGIIKIGVEGK